MWVRENPKTRHVLCSEYSHYVSALRSSYPEVFCKKVVLINFTKFTRKHLCQGLFYNKVAGLSPATLFKKVSGTGVFL